MQICRLVILDQQNLFLLISARITIYDIVISDQAEIDLRGIFEYIAFELQALEVSLIGLKHVLWILIICRRDIDNMNWNHGKVESYA